MSWYHLIDNDTGKWISLTVFILTFALILYRKFNVTFLPLGAGVILILLGLANPAEAFLSYVSWDVLAIYWGFGILADAFQRSNLPSLIVNRVLVHVKQEKYALFSLCILTMCLSSFMANAVVVIILSPIAIEMADKLKGSLFLYLVALAVCANVVTTVSMIADPPSLILATETGMNFLDFYWFQGRPGLGTITIIGLIVALLTLLWQFRRLNNRVDIAKEEIKASYSPLFIFILSIVALAIVPWNDLGTWNHPGIIGIALGFITLFVWADDARSILHDFDWQSLIFLAGIFIIVSTVNDTGLLQDFAVWLGKIGINSPPLYLGMFVWVSVALSSFIDNVPFTIIMIPICTNVARVLGVNPSPFYYGMLAGTGMGGNSGQQPMSLPAACWRKEDIK
jgi:Na+/H+ antiporter NhaD/arsenite permease-like protein